VKQPINYSIILPAYSEADNLRILLPQLNTAMRSLGKSYEIIVMDTATDMDDTAAICAANNAIHINRKPTNYYGDAVRTGIQSAQGEFTLFMDADGSHPPEFLVEMLAYSEANDLVIASRYMPGGQSENSALLIYFSRLLNLTYSFLLRMHLYDISNSLRLYRTEQLQRLALNCQNFDIIQEILYGLIKCNKQIKIKEIPFSFKKRINGKSKRNFFVFVYSYLRTLVKLFLRSSKSYQL
jgi:dolichol-phosphate mannosyltransferase